MRAGSARLAAGARQVALTVGAIAGVLCFLVMLAGLAFGVRPLVFLSGSMSPTIDTGALAIARSVPAADLRLGDIVSVPTPAGQRVTHRIVDVQHVDETAVLRLKGDANEAIDAAPYQVDTADVVLFSIPEVGFVLSWLTSPAGLFLLGLYAALLVSVIARGATAPRARRVKGGARRLEAGPVRPAAPVAAPAGGRHRASGPRRRTARSPILVLARGLLPSRSTGGRHRKGAPPRPARLHARPRVRPALTLPITAATIVAGGWVAGTAEPTLAAWADPGSVSGTTQTAYAVPAPPSGASCAALTIGASSTNRGINITWPANLAPLPLLSYNPSSSGLSGASTTVVDVNGGANKQLQVRYNPSTSTNWNKIVTVRATPRLTSVAAWTGPMTTWKFRTGGNGSTQPVCGDATPAVVEIRAPDGVTRTVAAQRTFISGATGCTADIGLCGTIEDASTIKSVTFNFRKVRSGVTTYFNGTAWTSTNVQVTAKSTVYNNQLTFYEDSNTATVYPNVTGTGVYTLTVTVTDSWDNVTTSVVSFTLT